MEATFSKLPPSECLQPGRRLIETCGNLQNRGLAMLNGSTAGPRIYMDANATTPLLPEVMEAMRPYWMEHFGNASSIHMDGQQARTALDRARENLAEFFNC